MRCLWRNVRGQVMCGRPTCFVCAGFVRAFKERGLDVTLYLGYVVAVALAAFGFAIALVVWVVRALFGAMGL